LKFHTFKIKNLATLILVEPRKNEFVWVYLYVTKKLRNGTISTELTKYVLFYLKGIHHIHWYKYLKSFRILSQKLKWKTKSKSKLFLSCKYSRTLNLKKPSPYYFLFNEIVSHTLSYKKPKALIYKNKLTAKIVLSHIEFMNIFN
jgi:hypothetical protein